MKEMARTLRNHRELLLNWFRARGEISNGSVEGLNNKAKLAMRKGIRIISNPEKRSKNSPLSGQLEKPPGSQFKPSVIGNPTVCFAC